MNTHYQILAATVAVIGLGACGGSNPSEPASPSVTWLSVEPDAAVTAGDPSGLVSLSVSPHEAGGWLSIEVCVDSKERPVAVDPFGDTECAELSGHWAFAYDQGGDPWVSRSWPGWAVVRFDREPGQAAMLFRASYEAPRGGATVDVTNCSWLLAEGSDVGVVCSSTRDARPLPLVTPDGSGDQAP